MTFTPLAVVPVLVGPLQALLALLPGLLRALGVSDASELVLINANTGETVDTIPGALPGVPPVLGRDAILFASETGLARHDVTTGQTGLWVRTSWLGQVTSPIVLANSRVYFGTEHHGLVCAKEKRLR